MPRSVKGSCLCGRIRFTVKGGLRELIACHCSQCRKHSGFHYAASSAQDDDIHLQGEEHLSWYDSSSKARRGFCRHCGSSLFWKQNSSSSTSILAGALDQPTGLRISQHIFCGDKGDFYEITDNAVQYLKYPQNKINN